MDSGTSSRALQRRATAMLERVSCSSSRAQAQEENPVAMAATTTCTPPWLASSWSQPAVSVSGVSTQRTSPATGGFARVLHQPAAGTHMGQHAPARLGKCLDTRRLTQTPVCAQHQHGTQGAGGQQGGGSAMGLFGGQQPFAEQGLRGHGDRKRSSRQVGRWTRTAPWRNPQIMQTA